MHVEINQDKGSSGSFKSILPNHIFEKVAWKQLLKAVGVFSIAYVALTVAYEQTALKRLFTDAVLETIGKVCVKRINKSYIAFYYLNAPHEGRYDQVKLITLPSGTTKTDLNAGNVQLKAVSFKLYFICYYPFAFGLALAFAIPLKFPKKLYLLVLSSIGLAGLVWARFMVFVMHHVPRVNGDASKVELAHQILNAHLGMSTMLIFMFVIGTSVWLNVNKA